MLYSRPVFDLLIPAAEFIYVGQLIPRKRVDLLLTAAAPLVARAPLRLAVVGTGPEEENLKALAERLNISDRVTFEGVLPSSQILDRIGRADLLVLPSDAEGWGVVVNEAFQVGVPVCVRATPPKSRSNIK